MFPLGLRFCFGLSYVLCSFRLHTFRLRLSWLLRYMFHVFLSLFSMFPLRALCFITSLSWTPQLPLTLSYCTSLTILRPCTCLPPQRIRSLVYISPVLVATNLRTNITGFSSHLFLRFFRTLRSSSLAPAVSCLLCSSIHSSGMYSGVDSQ